MSTHQRRHGARVVFYPQKVVHDRDGVPTLMPDLDNPSRPTRATVLPARAQRAEVPGQLTVNNVRLLVKRMPGLGPWARCDFWGRTWDIVKPPEERRNVPRQNRHFVVEVRERSPETPGGF